MSDTARALAHVAALPSQPQRGDVTLQESWTTLSLISTFPLPPTHTRWHFAPFPKPWGFAETNYPNPQVNQPQDTNQPLPASHEGLDCHRQPILPQLLREGGAKAKAR